MSLITVGFGISGSRALLFISVIIAPSNLGGLIMWSWATIILVALCIISLAYAYIFRIQAETVYLTAVVLALLAMLTQRESHYRNKG